MRVVMPALFCRLTLALLCPCYTGYLDDRGMHRWRLIGAELREQPSMETVKVGRVSQQKKLPGSQLRRSAGLVVHLWSGVVLANVFPSTWMGSGLLAERAPSWDAARKPSQPVWDSALQLDVGSELQPRAAQA